ncbi:MAG: hypothetical protein GTN59_14330, partial [Candidatus Dadabacteria bacterium]|nr:hypothetical protein [Candidatus Dadabacteria bacterium]
MGRRIQITESQLKYIVENAHLIKEGKVPFAQRSQYLADAKKDGTAVVF